MEEKIIKICRNCSYGHETSVYRSINVAEEPDLKEKVMSGDLFVWECPCCSQKNLIQEATLYHDPSQKLMIYFSPEWDEEIRAKMSALLEREESLGGYVARIVESIGDLIEKVKIYDEGLDDIVVEMCKYVTAMEMGRDIPGMKFLGMDGADSEIILTYPEKGEMQMLSIGFNVYEDCRGILQRNPYIKEKSTGFAVVDSRWISNFFK